MNNIIKTLLSLTLIFAMVLCALLACAENASLPLAEQFAYEPDEGEQNAEATRAANAAYRDRIAALVRDSDVVCESATLRFEVGQVLATDDFTALTWRVSNLTDSTVFIATNEFFATFSGIEYDVCGGLRWCNLALAPGESVNARFHGTLWSHFEPGEGEFSLEMKVYDISQEAEEVTALLDSGAEFYPEERGCPLLEEVQLAVPMTMEVGDVNSALPDGQPLEWEMDGYVLRVTQADISDVGAQFALERIYESKGAALADSPLGEDCYWSYELLSADGAKWVSTAFGSIPDAPIELEDGRWAWQYSTRVYYMVSRPNAVILRAERYVDNEYDESANEDITLTFE